MFFRLLLLITSFFFNLYACQDNYAPCIQKALDSHSLVNNTLSIPISKTERLVYAHATPNATILKSDPFLNLYLIKTSEPFAYPYSISNHLKNKIIITKKRAISGKYLKNQIGLNHLAQWSKKVADNAMVVDSCCFLEGISTQRGVIQKAYLRHFIESKSSLYGDIGIRLEQQRGEVRVAASDPFMKPNPFKKGDIILSFDKKGVKSASVLMQKILFSKLGSRHSVEIRRGHKLLKVSTLTQRRYGGGALSDTFLERYGLFFNKSLVVRDVHGRFLKDGLHVGDRLLAVNGKKVKSQKALREYLEKYKKYSSLLIERNNFQFFVNIK